tara:strand:+ start:181 stop:645 length:465 start_codon:yes stop_codon:yes gene_type:complete
MFKFQDILKFTKSDVKDMADNAVKNHKKQISAGFDFENKRFKPYSPAYAKRKGVSRSAVDLKLTGKMLNAFDVQRVTVRKNQEIQFLYGIKKNKQGTKMMAHSTGVPEKNLKKRSIAENQELGDFVENGIVKDFANTIGKNLSRMSKTRVQINI